MSTPTPGSGAVEENYICTNHMIEKEGGHGPEKKAEAGVGRVPGTQIHRDAPSLDFPNLHVSSLYSINTPFSEFCSFLTLNSSATI